MKKVQKRTETYSLMKIKPILQTVREYYYLHTEKIHETHEIHATTMPRKVSIKIRLQ